MSTRRSGSRAKPPPRLRWQSETALKEANRKLEAANEELDQRVALRTADLQAANASLREALELNRSIIEASALGIAAYKASGECVFANEAMMRIAGVDRAQVPRLNFRKLQSFQASPLLQMAEAALADGRPRSVELHGFSSAGGQVWGHHHLACFRMAGEPHLLSMVHDISEQKRAESFLIAQRDLAGFLGQTRDLSAALDRLIEAALQIPGADCGGVYLLEAEAGGFVLRVHRGLSQKFVDATAFYPADAAAVSLLQLARPLDTLPPDLAQRLERTLAAEGILGLTVVPLIHEGRLIGSFNLGSRVYREMLSSSRAAVEALAALVVGAVARIQAEDNLRQLNEALEQRVQDRTADLRAANAALCLRKNEVRTVVENSPDYIVRLDRTARHVYWNSAAVRLLGLPSEDLSGKSLRELGFPGAACQPAEQACEQVLSTGRAQTAAVPESATSGKAGGFPRGL